MSLRSAAVEHGGPGRAPAGRQTTAQALELPVPPCNGPISEFGLLLEDVFDLSDLLLDFAGEVFGFAFCL